MTKLTPMKICILPEETLMRSVQNSFPFVSLKNPIFPTCNYWGQSFRIDFLICQLEDINPKGLTLIRYRPSASVHRRAGSEMVTIQTTSHYWGQSFRIDFLNCQLEDINPKGLTLIRLGRTGGRGNGGCRR